jgi:protein involved in polysaccharide export with SLBB domain
LLIPFNLGKAILEGDPQHNLLLQPGDVITVFSKDDIRVPVAKQSVFVRLEGEVATGGVFQTRAGETLRQLVTRVGGLTPNAYLFGSEFTRESTRVLQQKRLEEIIDRLEQAIQRNLGTSVKTALSPEEATAAKAAAEGQMALVARLRKARATGRIVLELSPFETQFKNLPDLVLEDGDRFVVPPRPSTVAVAGTVYNENAFIYRSEKRLSDYLAQAGGPTKDADTDSLYLIRADGTVISKRQSGFLFSSLGGEKLMPGDTIVVPENLDKFRLSKELKDWSLIFYQFSLGAVGLKVLKGL